jgi:hypothetical protein
MHRRGFLAGFAAAVAVAASLLGATSRAVAADKPQQEFYELRTYRVANAEKQAVVSDYLENALVPALNRMGVKRVGVFTVMTDQQAEEQDLSIYALIAYPTLEMFAAVNPTLAACAEYQQAAAALHALTKKDPGYTRIESRLMKAFAGMPVMELPTETLEMTDRMFELRIYESHDDLKARLKVAMFNDGEIDIMRDVKMAPVFYGETLIGQDVPNLIYMLSASDMESHEAHWKAFIGHPEWDRIKKLPKYKDTVSNITKIYLVPTDYSQI